jgi:hypothetical protein
MASNIAIAACTKIVRAATAHCSVVHVVQPAASPAAPAFDPGGMTMALTGLATAFVWGTIVLAILALIGGLAWGYVVRAEATKEASKVAKEEARKVAAEFAERWLAEEAPRAVREHVELLESVRIRNTVGDAPVAPGEQDGGEPNPADEIGKAAG